MSHTLSVLNVQIERTIHPPNWRKTRYATFKRTDGYFLCEVFFALDTREPMMQIRSEANGLELAAAVAVAIQMAAEWATEEMARMRSAEVTT